MPEWSVAMLAQTRRLRRPHRGYTAAMNLVALIVAIVLAVIVYIVVGLVAPFWLAIVAALLVFLVAAFGGLIPDGRTRA